MYVKIKSKKSELKFWYGLFYFVPVFLSIVYFLQWHNEPGQILLISIIVLFWILATIASVKVTMDAIKNPYPFHYLVDYDTLVSYFRDEEKFSIDNKLEAGFNVYLYLGEERVEIQSWHHSFSSFKEEIEKGDVIYYNNEAIKSFDDFLNNKLSKFEGHILIELRLHDNLQLNEYRKNHPELDVKSFIDNFNSRL